MISDELAQAAVHLARNDPAMLARVCALIEADEPPPRRVRYRDDTWLGLPDTDHRKVAATRLAAECWHDHCSPERVAEDMQQALDDIELALAQRARETSWDVSAGRDWQPSPSHDELQDRRTA